MKIMIDCYQLIKGQGKSIGIYNYTKDLLDKLIPIISKNYEVVILNNSKNINDFEYKDVANIIISKDPEGVFDKVSWEIIKIPFYIKKYSVDIYFSPRGFLPIIAGKCKLITTIHDLIPMYYKENYRNEINRLENWYIVDRLKKSAQRSDKIITISNFSKDELINKFNISDRKIEVIYNGLNDSMEVSDVKKEEEYIFSISSSKLKHKNLEAILKSYEMYYRLSENPLKMKICGVQNKEDFKEFIEVEAFNNIEFLPFISNEELNWCYKNANVFLFLSKIEGFGFPPLESLKFSTPVICSDIPCFREILDGDVEFVDEENYGEVANALIKYEEINSKIINSNFIKEKFSWSVTAEKISKVFDDVT